MCTPKKGKSVEEFLDEKIKERRDKLLNAPKHSMHSIFRKQNMVADTVRYPQDFLYSLLS